jgi:predicted HTH transcriptional regulator
MTSEQLIEKIQQGENETFELRTDIRDHLLLSKLIGAFSNNKGGQIVFGVREPIEIVGTDTKRLINMVERAKTILKPNPKLTTEIITVNNKELFVIEIEKSNEIVFAGGSVFQRIEKDTRPMPLGEIKFKLKTISSNNNSLSILANSIEKQSLIIDELREEINISNSWRTKLRDNFISGLIGAILGFLASLLIK